jgi:hypothetical protein
LIGNDPLRFASSWQNDIFVIGRDLIVLHADSRRSSGSKRIAKLPDWGELAKSQGWEGLTITQDSRSL